MLRRLALPALVVCALIAVPSCASAASSGAFFAGSQVDVGPGVRSPDVDLALDGGGAMVYVKQDGGVDHVFVSRLVSGRWQAPERLDAALTAPASKPVVAASDGGKLVVAFISGDQLYTVIHQAGAPNWQAPVAGPAGVTETAIDMSINGVAYVVWSQQGNVLAARLEKNGTSFTGLTQRLDINPGDVAGTLAGEAPRVAVSADGVALVVFGEVGHVFARHLFELRVSTTPQQLDVADFQGRGGAGGDQPDVAVENDSSYAWVVFTQRFVDGGSRTLARHLRGSLFDSAVDISKPGPSTELPRVALNGTGVGIASNSGSDGSVFFDPIVNDEFTPAATAWGAGPVVSQSRVAMATGGTALLSWMVGAPGSVQVQGAWMQDGKSLTRSRLDDPALGPVIADAGYDADMDKYADGLVVFVQGGGDERRLVAAALDRAPRSFSISTTSVYRNRKRPKLAWAPSIDAWGPVSYTVSFDGAVLGTTTNRATYPGANVADGVHRLVVRATDPRGQSYTKSSFVRIDTVRPTAVLHTSGLRQEGQKIGLSVDASDPKRPVAAGIRQVTIDPGDGSGVVEARTLTHVYAPGTYTVTARVTDRATNVKKVTTRLTIKAKPKPKPKKKKHKKSTGT